MRGVYYIPPCVAAPDFREHLFEGRTAPRPGVISVLCRRDDEEQAAFQSRAERAVRARAFPMFVYDPDRADASPWNERMPIIRAFRRARKLRALLPRRVPF